MSIAGPGPRIPASAACGHRRREAPARDGRGAGSATPASAAPGSVDDRVALLPHELDRVVHRQAGLAGAPRGLPAAEGLDARPRPGGRTGLAVDVEHARLAPLEELLDLRPVLAVD